MVVQRSVRMLRAICSSLLPMAAFAYGRTTPGFNHKAHTPLAGPTQTVRSMDAGFAKPKPRGSAGESSGTHSHDTVTRLNFSTHLALERDINVSTDNPFFEDGVPYYKDMPGQLLQQIRAAGCAHAWRRQRHRTSPIDRKCTAMVRDFIFGAPGALLGFMYATLDAPGGFGYLYDVNPKGYATTVTEDLVVEDSSGARRVDLSSVSSYTGAAPLMLYPDINATYDEIFNATSVEVKGAVSSSPVGLDFPERRVIDMPPFIVHQAGAWSLEYAGGGANASNAANEKAFKHCAELWLYIGHHSKQGDTTDQLLKSNGGLLIHGMHGATWALVVVHMERDHPTPTTALWDLVNPACGAAQSVDFSLYVSCVHGLGHTLTFYFSSGRASVAESVGVCAHAAPDSRLVSSCADGFYHEMERAGIFLEPSLGQHYLPAGARLPCDHEGPHPFLFECFAHLKNSAIKDRGSFARDGDPWATSTTLSDGRTLTSLSAAGQQIWRDCVAFCADETSYPHFTQRTACITAFAEWFDVQLIYVLTNPRTQLWDAASFAMPAGAPRLQPSGPDDVSPPKLLGTMVSTSVNRSVEEEALGPYVHREDLPALLCEAASTSFWAWLPCSQTSNTVCSPLTWLLQCLHPRAQMMPTHDAHAPFPAPSGATPRHSTV